MLSKLSFVGIATGTLIEYYDYALLAIFLPILSPLFFPGETEFQSLVYGYVLLFIAAIARPLGGIFFGNIGDSLGRRQALVCSIIGISFSSLLIAGIPAYTSIGWWAPFSLLLLKSIQVFCFGGEYNGAGIYVVELSRKKEALTGSILTAATLGGFLLASLVGILITLPQMPAHAWRFGFLLSGLLGLSGFWLRRHLSETAHFRKHTSWGKLLHRYPRQLCAGFWIGGMGTVPFTTVFTFMNPVLTTQQMLTHHGLMYLQTALILLCITTLILAGYIADKKSPQFIMRTGAALLAILAIPALLGADIKNFYWIIFGEIALLIVNEILLGPSNAYLKQIFEESVRYRASSISFTLGMSVIGGLTPLVESALFTVTHTFTSIAIWLIFVALCTFFSIRAATAHAT